MKRCFVISPIGPEGSNVRHHADDVFRFIIEPAMNALDIEAVRSDQMPETGRITRQMFREIFEADVCIALLTGLNPNVFYELAVAQCAARPVVILIQEGQDLPFDVKDLRCVNYATEPIGPLVDGFYRDRVIEQLKNLDERGWLVPSLFQQFGSAPRLQTEQQIRHLIEDARPKTLPSATDRVYALPADSERRIAIVTGDLLELTDVRFDAVVSLENTDLQLGPYYDQRLTGKLRYVDAEKSAGGRVVTDTLKESLQKELEKLNVVLPLQPGSVIATPTNQLAKRGIRMVFHLAALQGSLGQGYRMPDDMIEDCVRSVFNKFADLAESEGLETLLLPMLGAYTTRVDHLDVARQILKPVVNKMKQFPACRTTYLLAWIESQRYAFRKAAEELGLEELRA